MYLVVVPLLYSKSINIIFLRIISINTKFLFKKKKKRKEKKKDLVMLYHLKV
jgi:hypothetical protein